MSTKRRTGRKAKSLQAHQHILVSVPRSRSEQLRCCLPGCNYGEYWSRALRQYLPYMPPVYGVADTKANKRKLEAASASAIRPHALWESLESVESEQGQEQAQ